MLEAREGLLRSREIEFSRFFPRRRSIWVFFFGRGSYDGQICIKSVFCVRPINCSKAHILLRRWHPHAGCFTTPRLTWSLKVVSLLLFLNESLYQERAKMRGKKVIFPFSIEELIGFKLYFFRFAQYGRAFLFLLFELNSFYEQKVRRSNYLV